MTKKQVKTKKDSDLQPRPPVVVILGHVDHGKTSLLDYIRKTKVAEKEAGAITQHIGAYQVEVDEKLITFIDTPGHEAFSAMRRRGGKIADIAVLVVAAGEGVKPQTVEAIECVRKAKIPIIVAINKVDLPQANSQRVKKELAKQDILVEDMGGEVISIETSAKTGDGIKTLLEMILLVADMQELKANTKGAVSGAIVEAHLDPKRGPTATVLVKSGVLRKKDIIVAGKTYGKIKEMEDFKGKFLDQAFPSTPALILGLKEVPSPGDILKKVESEEEAIDLTRASKEPSKPSKSAGQFKKSLKLIVKADVKGTLEAVIETLKSVEAKDVGLEILGAEVGDINENDIKQARAAKAIIIGFNKTLPRNLRDFAERQRVRTKTFNVIYELVEGVRKELGKLLEPEKVKKTLGEVKILKVFKTTKEGQIVGGKVTVGKIEKGAGVNVRREEKSIGQGKISRLQQKTKEKRQIKEGQECGVFFKGETKIEEGDTLEVYREEEKKRVIGN